MACSKKVVKMFTVIRHISRAWGVKLLLKQPFGTIIVECAARLAAKRGLLG